MSKGTGKFFLRPRSGATRTPAVPPGPPLPISCARILSLLQPDFPAVRTREPWVPDIGPKTPCSVPTASRRERPRRSWDASSALTWSGLRAQKRSAGSGCSGNRRPREPRRRGAARVQCGVWVCVPGCDGRGWAGVQRGGDRARRPSRDPSGSSPGFSTDLSARGVDRCGRQ